MSYTETFLLGFSGFFIFTSGFYLGTMFSIEFTVKSTEIVFNSLVDSGELQLNNQ